MKKVNMLVSTLCIVVFASVLAFSQADAGETQKLSGKQFAQLAMGGVLYDNWLEVLGVKVDKTHPSYPPEGKEKGAVTWRCKECHGWDYKGKSGAYSSGSHYTGIAGIRGSANLPTKEIIKVLKDDRHAFSAMIPEEALEALALFVAYGQIDMDLYIDRSTRKGLGDPANGGRIYLATCTHCHGNDGKEINFKTPEKPEYIGTVANKNPWETLHKISWGQPAVRMIALHFLGLKEQLDVLAFCQTLPDK